MALTLISKISIFFLIISLICSFFSIKFIELPEGLEQKDQIIWIYLETKLIRILSYLGELFGVGHKMILTRKISQFIHSFPLKNDTRVKIKPEVFDGVDVILIEPWDKDEYGGALIWIHGGGFTYGNADMDNEMLKEFSYQLNMTVVSINYRKAPEHPFPVGLNDCYLATYYFISNSVKFNVDPFRIAVAGYSSGGNLAAALTIKLRENRNYFFINKLQILITPCLQTINFNLPSYLSNEADEFLPKFNMIEFWLWYALGHQGHFYLDFFINNSHSNLVIPNAEKHFLMEKNKKFSPNNPWNLWFYLELFKNLFFNSNKIKYLPIEIEIKIKKIFNNSKFAPLMSEQFKNQPKTFIATAEFDILKDEGIFFANKLKENNVEVIHNHYSNGFHDLLLWKERYSLSKIVFNDIVSFLRKNL